MAQPFIPTPSFRRLSCLGLASLASAACADPARTSSSAEGVLVGALLSPARASAPAQRALAHSLAAGPVASGRMADGSWVLASSVDDALAAATEDGRELWSFLVACAFPADATIVSVRNPGFVFFGAVGLAPSWARRPLDVAGRQWVSACVFAELSYEGVPTPVSLRGPSLALAALSEERGAWTLEEGAYYGDLFGDPTLPLPWFACQGSDVEAAARVERVCAQPDVGRPGLTRCGLVDAGPCDVACAGVVHGERRACRAPGLCTDRAVTAFAVP
jgi:hypothetical protein